MDTHHKNDYNKQQCLHQNTTKTTVQCTNKREVQQALYTSEAVTKRIRHSPCVYHIVKQKEFPSSRLSSIKIKSG